MAARQKEEQEQLALSIERNLTKTLNQCEKWLLAFGLIIISSILASIVGMILCGIGSLFTAAFVYHPVYIIYKEVIGFGGADEIDTIGYLTE